MKKIVIFFSLVLSIYSKGFSDKSVFLTTTSTKSNELVYDYNSGKKISELIWKAKDVQMVGFLFNYNINKANFYRFRYLTNISNNAIMDDYDWLDENISTWTHWSQHPDTQLNRFNIIDISYNNLLQNKQYGIKKYLIAGFKIEDREFKAYNGNYIYSQNGGFRNKKGNLSGLGVTYKERFESIYFGIKGVKKVNRFNIFTKLLYSPQVSITNKDNHHFRSFVTDGSFTTTMKSFFLNLEYILNKNISFLLKYENTKYKLSKSLSTITFYETTSEANKGDRFLNSEGIKNTKNHIGFSIVFNLD